MKLTNIFLFFFLYPFFSRLTHIFFIFLHFFLLLSADNISFYTIILYNKIKRRRISNIRRSWREHSLFWKTDNTICNFYNMIHIVNNSISFSFFFTQKPYPIFIYAKLCIQYLLKNGICHIKCLRILLIVTILIGSSIILERSPSHALNC